MIFFFRNLILFLTGTKMEANITGSNKEHGGHWNQIPTEGSWHGDFDGKA